MKKQTGKYAVIVIDMLEDFDDVQNVYHNAEIADDVLALVE